MKIVARNTLNQPIEIRSFQLNGVEYLAKNIVLKNSKDKKSPLNPESVILAPNRWLSDTPRNDVLFKIPLPDTFDETNSSSVISNARILGLEDFLQKSVVLMVHHFLQTIFHLYQYIQSSRQKFFY